jgi:arylformamidase
LSKIYRLLRLSSLLIGGQCWHGGDGDVYNPAMSRRQDRVFLDYTQEQLDQAYDQLVWAPHRDAIQAEIRKDCEAVRRRCRRAPSATARARCRCSTSFAPDGRLGRAGAWSTLHGGAWLRGSRLDVAYPAPALH